MILIEYFIVLEKMFIKVCRIMHRKTKERGKLFRDCSKEDVACTWIDFKF